MNPSDFLSVNANISVAIIGFSSVIVALSKEPLSQWSKLDRFNFRLLIQVAAVTTFFSILPLILLNVFDEQIAWKYGLILYGTFHILDVTTFVIKVPQKLPTLTKVTTIIGFSIAITQLFTGFFGDIWLHQLLYYTGLLWQLAISFMGFAFLINSR